VKDCETTIKNLRNSVSSVASLYATCRGELQKRNIVMPTDTISIADAVKIEMRTGGLEPSEVRDLIDFLEKQLPPNEQECDDLDFRVATEEPTCKYFVNFECTYNQIGSYVYLCIAKKVEVNHRNSQVHYVDGKHDRGKSHRDVTKMVVANQKMKYIPMMISYRFVNLRELTIDRSDLRDISVGIFNGFNSLEVLTITNNNMRSIKAGAFMGLTSLKRIDLSNNKISDIQANVFSNLRKLDFLAVNDNKLQTLRAIFGCDNRIETLLVQNNQIANIDSDLLACMSQLETFNFRDNLCASVSDTNADRVIKTLETRCTDSRL
jgi:Leucine rich repeat